MLKNIIRKNKGVLILIVMVLGFSFIAAKRVDTLEKNDISNTESLVYNR